MNSVFYRRECQSCKSKYHQLSARQNLTFFFAISLLPSGSKIWFDLEACALQSQQFWKKRSMNHCTLKIDHEAGRWNVSVIGWQPTHFFWPLLDVRYVIWITTVPGLINWIYFGIWILLRVYTQWILFKYAIIKKIKFWIEIPLRWQMRYSFSIWIEKSLNFELGEGEICLFVWERGFQRITTP